MSDVKRTIEKKTKEKKSIKKNLIAFQINQSYHKVLV